MDAEVSAQIAGAVAHGEADSETRLTSAQRLPAAALGTRCAGHDRTGHPEAARGQLLRARCSSRGGAVSAPCISVVTQAYVEGVSTRRVDDLVRSLGCDGISKSRPSTRSSRASLERPARTQAPTSYLWLDAGSRRARARGGPRRPGERGRTPPTVSASGKRELLGSRCRHLRGRGVLAERVLRGLVARGLSGVELVTSGLPTRASGRRYATVFAGASWQRCRTHLMLQPADPGAEERARSWWRTTVRLDLAKAVHRGRGRRGPARPRGGAAR